MALLSVSPFCDKVTTSSTNSELQIVTSRALYLIVGRIFSPEIPGLPPDLEPVIFLGQCEPDIGRHEAVEDGHDDPLKHN